jgi:allantoicase
MGDGWETRRRRGPGFDWVVLRLGHAGSIERVELDTAHFKGNYPDRASLQAAFVVSGAEPDAATLAAASQSWPVLLAEGQLDADRLHVVGVEELAALGPVSHVRLNIYPDGGVSRLRLFGRLDETAAPFIGLPGGSRR